MWGQSPPIRSSSLSFYHHARSVQRGRGPVQKEEDKGCGHEETEKIMNKHRKSWPATFAGSLKYGRWSKLRAALNIRPLPRYEKVGDNKTKSKRKRDGKDH